MPHILCYLAGSAARASSAWASGPAGIRLAASVNSVRRISSVRAASDANLHAITWTCADPQHLTPEALASSFTHFRPASVRDPIVPVLFASPEFAPWTDPSASLLADWVNPLLKRVYAGESPDVVHTVAAIVDKIATRKNAHSTPTGVSGAEGLSLLLVDSNNITASTAQPIQIRGGSSTEPAFFFSARSTPSNRAISKQDVQTTRQVGLRLANTIFVNGKDRTLLGMRWIYDKSSGTYVLDNWKDLSTCDVTFVSGKAQSSVDVPLHPVTRRRSVVSSMGNILRQLSDSASSTTDPSSAIPASSELEKELPKYVKELGIPHQRVAVWALVEPPNSRPTEQHGRGDLGHSIVNGSRIHRVVSGGGGWGKKQGLLSLDPEISFHRDSTITEQRTSLDQALSTQSPRTDSDEAPDISALSDFLGKGLEEEIASLSQVVPVGDSVQFLVATHPEAIRETTEQSQNDEKISCSFGVGASAVTELTIPQSASAQGAAEPIHSSDPVLVTPNHFGGMSEIAISYSQQSTPELSTEGGQCQTKLSVPGSRVDIWLS